MEVADLTQGLAAYIDRRHPRFGSKLMKLRFGGLRTVQPGGALVVSVVAGGVGSGIAVRHLLGRVTGGRLRISVAPTLLVGPVAAWTALWRWDSATWRRRHVTMVLDLPAAQLDALIEQLAVAGVPAERWTGPRVAGGADSGLSCRLRDLRRVNSIIDALDETADPDMAEQTSPRPSATSRS